MEVPNCLSEEDWAKSAKVLPLKVIRVLGHQLHRHMNSSGNWEMLAEELGYEYEDIKRFSATATIRQEVTPGELLLRDWVDQCGNGHTLYVLRNALCRTERYDCAEYMEKEVFNNVIHMDLTVCIRDEVGGTGTQHVTVRTRTDASLLQSLQNLLQQPLETSYRLLDPGATWTHTLAKQYKGRALMLQKTVKFGMVGLDQDPTIDSSSMDEITADVPSGLNLAAPPRTARNRPVNLSDPRHQQLPSHSIRAVPNRRNTEQNIHSTTVKCYNQRRSVPELTLSYPSGIADSSDRNESAILRLRHMIDRNTLCDTREDLLQNNLNVQATDNVLVCPEKVFTGSERQGEMNISESESKLDNVTRKERNNAYFHPGKETNPSEVRAETRQYSDRIGIDAHNEMDHDLNDSMMMDSDYQDNFSDGESHPDNVGDFGTNGGQTVEMECLKLGFDAASEDSRAAFNDLKVSSLFDSIGQYDNETSHTISSVDSDKKFSSFQESGIREKAPCVLKASDLPEEPTTVGSSGKSLTFTLRNIQMLTKQREAEGAVENGPFYEKEKAIEALSHVGRAGSSFTPRNIQILTKQREADDAVKNGQFYEKEKAIGALSYGGRAGSLDGSGSDCPMTEMFPFRGQVTSEHRNLQVDHERGKLPDVVKQDATGQEPDRGTCGYPYIDFNNFTQITQNQTQPFVHTGSFSLASDAHFECDSRFNNESECSVGRSCSQTQAGRFGYEGLQRHISCPADFRPYETSETAMGAFSTIADVFSPVTENPPTMNFEERYDETAEEDDGNIPEEPLQTGNINKFHTLPLPKPAVKTEKTKRHTFTHGQNFPAHHVHFSDRQAQAMEQNGSIPPPRPHKFLRVESHPYKIVVQGRGAKKPSDGSLSGDNLFSFYNNKLRGEPGWSPLETEYTVETTMRDVIDQDGYYMLWYNRTKKNLMITISDRGKFVHIRVRSKLLNNHMHFYIIPGHFVRDVRELLKTSMEQGLSLNSNRMGTGLEMERRVWLKCPVMVQYEKRPAVSV